jgi:UDP-2,3-diacylglucosamine hydrolase
MKRQESLFISDLHLSAERPWVVERFLGFIEFRAAASDCLFILGDLFDAYIGDDNNAWPFGAVKKALKQCTQGGTKVYFQNGNRDFLLGERFVDETGVILLGDYHVHDLYGTQTLLTHGDLLCTDDVKYQLARIKVRSDEWKSNALSKPLWIRRLYARWYRYKSGLDKGNKSYDIMDANLAKVNEILKEYGSFRMIHGHTHRPQVHDFQLDGHLVQRFVLPEWNGEESILCWDEKGFQWEGVTWSPASKPEA